MPALLLRNHGTHWIDLALYPLHEHATEIWGDAKLVSDAGDAEDHCKIIPRMPGGCVVDIPVSTSCAVKLPATDGLRVPGHAGFGLSQDADHVSV